MWRRDRERQCSLGVLHHPNPPKAASHDVSQSERWRSRSLIAIFRAGGRLRAICTIPSSGFGGKFISVTLAAWRWFGGRRTATKKRLAWSATNFLFARKKHRGWELSLNLIFPALSSNFQEWGGYETQFRVEMLTTWRAGRSPLRASVLHRWWRGQAGCATAVLQASRKSARKPVCAPQQC